MSIDRLRYFAAVVETGNLRKAASLVGIAPSSMSKAIALLEEELGHKLLHPEGRGIGITPKGREIYRLSTALLDEHRRFFARLREPQVSSTQLRLATFEVFSTYFLSAFLREQKEMDLLLLEKTPGQIEAAILSGEVDMGITYLPAPDNRLDYTEVGFFSMGLFGRKKWETVDFALWPFAVPTSELKIFSSDVEALDLWPPSAPARRIKHRMELLETALQAASEGLAVLHCPAFVVQLHNERVKAPFQLAALPAPKGYNPPRPVKIYLVSRKGSDSSELERKLARFIRLLNRTESPPR